MRGEPADPAVLPGADAVLNPRVHPVRSVDIAQLGPPAAQLGGHVRYPQGVTPAVLGLEQAQLGAGMRPLPAGEDPHRRRPAVQLVPARAFAQQPGQLGDVRFFDPAPRMPAGRSAQASAGPALAHLAALIDGDLPGLRRDEPDRVALAGAQLPADGVGQLVPGPGRQLIKAGDQPVAGPGPIRGHHQPPPERRRQRRDRVTEHLQVISGRCSTRRCPGASSRPAAHRCYRSTRARDDARSP